jgi:hypothetical protein
MFAAAMLRLTVAVAVRLPEVPVTVTAVGPPVDAELPTARVRVLVEVAGLVPNVAVTPLGSADGTASVTLPLKPFSGFTVIVLVPLAPWATLKEVGEAERSKLGLCCDWRGHEPPPPQPDQHRIASRRSKSELFFTLAMMPSVSNYY